MVRAHSTQRPPVLSHTCNRRDGERRRRAVVPTSIYPMISLRGIEVRLDGSPPTRSLQKSATVGVEFSGQVLTQVLPVRGEMAVALHNKTGVFGVNSRSN